MMQMLHDVVGILTPIYACGVSALIIIILDSINHTSLPHEANRHNISSTSTKDKKHNINESINVVKITSTGKDVNERELNYNDEWKQNYAGHWSVVSREGFKEVNLS